MPSNIARYSFSLILIHWALALTIFVMLGLGWYIQYIPPTTQSRSFLLDLHMSLGLTSGLLLSIQIFLRIVFKPPSFPNEFPQWQGLLAHALYALIYLSFTLILISGYLQAVFNATHLQFWGIPLPVWGVVDVTLAGFFEAVHGVTAVVLVGLIFVHVGVVGLNIFKYPGIATRMLLGTQESPDSHGSEESPILSKIAQRLARNLRLFGWIAFWLQLVLALICGVLLEFATSGRAFSPAAAGGFGDAIYWGVVGFLLLWLAIPLAFYWTRAARKILARPDDYTPTH
jgi:cytochrome b561